jgi:phage terminase Nu1 subunit (DNA packaging protein)
MTEPGNFQKPEAVSRRKFEPMRWTLNRASSEFDIDARGLSRRLKRQDIQPGEDGRFSTAQIVSAIFDDRYSEELRKIRLEADRIELANKATRGELIELAVVEREWIEIATDAKTKMLTIPTKLESKLGLTTEQRKAVEAEIDEVLEEISREPNYGSGNEKPVEAEE